MLTQKKVQTLQCDLIAREIYLPPNHEHRHDCFEISYGAKGKCLNTINGITFPLDATTCHIIRPTDTHRFTNGPTVSNAELYKHIDIYANPAIFKKACDGISETFFEKFMSSSQPIVFDINGSLIQTISNKVNSLIFQSAEESTLNIFLYFVLTTLLSAYFEQLHFRQTMHYPQWMNELLKKLQTIEFLSMTIEQLAADINYSPAHLSREFKKYMGIKLIDYIKNERIKYSLSLLQSQNLKIIEIATILGYEKQSTFSSLFKEIMNCSPKEYQLAVNKKHFS